MKHLALPFICSIICACNQYDTEPHIAADKSKNVEKQSEDKDNIINNKYTNIALSLCEGDVGKSRYTTANTEYFDLNTHEGIDCFVFASQLSCSYPSGSCGSAIRVIKKTGKNYEHVFGSCGFNIEHLIEVSFGYHAFTYKRASNRVAVTAKICKYV